MQAKIIHTVLHNTWGLETHQIASHRLRPGRRGELELRQRLDRVSGLACRLRLSLLRMRLLRLGLCLLLLSRLVRLRTGDRLCLSPRLSLLLRLQ